MSLSPLSKHNIAVALVLFSVSLAVLIFAIVFPYMDFSKFTFLDEDTREWFEGAQQVFKDYPESTYPYFVIIGAIISFLMMMGIVKRNIFMLIPAILTFIGGAIFGVSYTMFMMRAGIELVIQVGLYVAGAVFLFINPLISVALEILNEMKAKKHLYK